jgi:hypothetical protein
LGVFVVVFLRGVLLLKRCPQTARCGAGSKQHRRCEWKQGALTGGALSAVESAAANGRVWHAGCILYAPEAMMIYEIAVQYREQASNYRVEVSGWDATETFFLEKTVLYWDEAGQQISVRTPMREGSVVFVQLIQPFAGEENFPVAYVVVKTLPVEMDGRVIVAISRLHPKPSYRQAASNLRPQVLVMGRGA